MKKNTFILFICLLTAVLVQAQDEFFDLPEDTAGRAAPTAVDFSGELGTDLITPRGSTVISNFQSMFGNDLHCLSLLAFLPTPPVGKTEYIIS